MQALKSSAQRFSERSTVVAAALLLIAAYWLVSALTLGWALTGSLVIAAWAALWPAGRSVEPPAELPQAVPATAQPPSSASKLTSHDWQTVLDGIPSPAILLDPRSVIVAANAATRDVIAVRTGQQLSFVMRSPDLHAAVDRARGSGTTQTAEVRITVPVERSLTAYATPLAHGLTDIGPTLLIVFRDRTEEQQLTQLRADFVANASHELRTPLTSVKGFIETLRGAARDDPPARERFLGIMQEQAERMSRLIEDLLSLSRIEMREHLPPRDVVDLGDIAEAVTGSMRPLAEAGGQRLTLSRDAATASVRGDRDELEQVAQNLVQNSIKYGKPDGRVEIKVARAGTSLSFSVSDDGIGIAPEHVPRLTERFYRVSAKHSRERGGTGLGLAIVKHIVNRHHGELKIASELGKGSTFTVILPVLEKAS